MLRFFYMLALWELWTLALWMLMLPCSAASGRKESRAVGTWWRPSRCVWRRSLRDHESTEVDRMRPLQWCHQRVSLLLVMRSIHQWSPMVWYYLKYIMYGSYYKYKDMSYIIYGYQMKLQLNKATFCTKKLSKKEVTFTVKTTSHSTNNVWMGLQHLNSTEPDQEHNQHSNNTAIIAH